MAFEASSEESSQSLDSVSLRTRELTMGANAFSRAMTGAFRSSVIGGRQFDDVLKSLTLRLSDMAVRLAFKPLEKSISGGIESLLSGLVGAVGSGDASPKFASGAVKPFASGGVIGTPTYFPLMQGGVGLAGEAGPEAIMPLARGPDGKLGVTGRGGGNSITIQIATPDLESFRRSENYITGQIARAVSRGQRNL
ncbi:phage tail tape measure protein [Afipia birgiae]|jgi:lambda family phage tail tape measure protein|uniref:phage tail tape measure protein n=1 Tax=Afipia birgiae TaxID=151414 RepID=UPI0002FD1165|nr:phage tail tape measure protein [Afipia birgiae]MBX9822310.1 phage tail tape measure protein [Afipia birgiae]